MWEVFFRNCSEISQCCKLLHLIQCGEVLWLLNALDHL